MLCNLLALGYRKIKTHFKVSSKNNVVFRCFKKYGKNTTFFPISEKKEIVRDFSLRAFDSDLFKIHSIL